MRNNKILTIAVILLLVINIGMIIFMVRGKSHHDENHPPRTSPLEAMDKDLNLTDDQKAQVKKLRDDHFTVIRPLFDSSHAAKAAYFSLLKDPNVTDSILAVYDKRITDIQSTIDKQTFMHFRTVRALFNQDQQQKYDEFIQKMMQRKKDSTNRHP